MEICQEYAYEVRYEDCNTSQDNAVELFKDYEKAKASCDFWNNSSKLNPFNSKEFYIVEYLLVPVGVYE